MAIQDAQNGMEDTPLEDGDAGQDNTGTTTTDNDCNCASSTFDLYSIPQIAVQMADVTNTDILLYNGPIQRSFSYRLMDLCSRRKRHDDIMLILTTEGGDPDAAFLIARYFQCHYDHFKLFVPGICKSAGTLIATGAHELIMSDLGELGPLDVQIDKPDVLGAKHSGWVPKSAIETLNSLAYQAFERFFLNTTVKSGGQITVPTAAKIATDMTVGLFAPIYQQVDPMRLGEFGRAIEIANHYGELLSAKGCNLHPDGLLQLVAKYPSHSFVIDRVSACGLFLKVREPSKEEALLAQLLDEISLWPESDSAVIEFLSELPNNEDNTNTEEVAQNETAE